MSDHFDAMSGQFQNGQTLCQDKYMCCLLYDSIITFCWVNRTRPSPKLAHPIQLYRHLQNVSDDSYGPAVHGLAIRFPPEHLRGHIAWGTTRCGHLLILRRLGQAKVADHDLGIFCRTTYIYIYIILYFIHTICIHTCMYACIHTYTCTYLHTYIHTYIHTYLCTYTYIGVHNHVGQSSRA